MPGNGSGLLIRSKGGFTKGYFSLVLKYLQNDDFALRIYGVSERWDSDISRVIDTRYRLSQGGFPSYKLESQEHVALGVYIRTFTFIAGGTTQFRSYEVAKAYGGLVRFLTVMGEVNSWGANQEVMSIIISSIRY